MKIERVISWFDRKNESLIGEYNVDFIPFETLKSIFNPKLDDPLMYNPYDIHIEHIDFFKKYVDIEFDLDKYIYQIDCFQI